MLKQVMTKNAPKAVGPYSQAIIDEELKTIYLSGQIAINPETNVFDESQSIEQQTKRIIQNLKAVLEDAGSDMGNILKVRIYMTDMSNFPKVNQVYGEFFSNHKPARVTVGVTSLPLGAKIEIECEAKMSSNGILK